jgi:hypothetical protein
MPTQTDPSLLGLYAAKHEHAQTYRIPSQQSLPDQHLTLTQEKKVSKIEANLKRHV